MTDISTVVTTVADDGFAAVADAEAPKSILVGRLVRFRKGDFVVGRDETDLLGATLVAHGVTRLWQKWHESAVVEQIPFVRGQFFPRGSRRDRRRRRTRHMAAQLATLPAGSRYRRRLYVHHVELWGPPRRGRAQQNR